MDVISRFSRYYFGDEMMTRLDVDIVNRQVSMFLTGALLLKPGDNPPIFAPELKLAPVVVRFSDCQELVISDGSFAFNNTVVEFSATPRGDNRTEFHFSLTGGWNDDTFWRKLTIVAGDFTITDRGTTV